MSVGDAVVHWCLCRAEDVPENDSWLGPAERQALSLLRFEKRRTDWRLGRWTAKSAVVAAMGSGWKRSESYSSLEIIAADDGAPEVWVGGSRGAVVVTISHRAGVAICAATERAIRLGCDVEVVEPRSARFVQDYFTVAEASLIVASSGDDASVLANVVWSAKESALKALREGLRRDTRSVEIWLRETPEVDGWKSMGIDAGVETTFEGRWCVLDGLVVTIVAQPPWRPLRAGLPSRW